MTKKIIYIFVLVMFAAILKAESAPDFQAETIDGRKFDLRDFRGKVVLLDFWAAWCPPCRESVPELKRIKQKFATANFEIISLSLDSDEQRARSFIAENKMNWIHVINFGTVQNIARKYGVEYIPIVFIVDKKGNIWRADLYNLEGAIRKLLQ